MKKIKILLILTTLLSITGCSLFVDSKNDVTYSMKEAKAELMALFRQEANFIIISNELGMGLHAETDIGRKFTDLQGWMNQFIAAEANEVYLMVSGIPVKVK